MTEREVSAGSYQPEIPPDTRKVVGQLFALYRNLRDDLLAIPDRIAATGSDLTKLPDLWADALARFSDRFERIAAELSLNELPPAGFPANISMAVLLAEMRWASVNGLSPNGPDSPDAPSIREESVSLKG